MEDARYQIDGVIDGLDELAEIDLFAEELPERINPIRLATESTISTTTGCLGTIATISV